jgi:peroxiredoxin Q/BCP
MRKLLFASSAVSLLASPAIAALPVGSKAPEVITMGATGGKPFKFNLKQELRKGPVVLYFFPKAFTKGCTLEAHAFSDAAAKFRQEGAQVIGLSAGDLPTLERFSVEACRNQFPVGVASPEKIKAYDVSWTGYPGMTDRTSYVIDRNGKVVFAYSDLDWSHHVEKTLAAVSALKH